MRRVFKWVLVLVITLVILLLALSITLPLLLDPNNFKDEISQAVRDRTGRELTIAGDISWRVFPSLGLEIEQLSLANRAGFGDRPMIEMANASVAVKLTPLLSRQLEVGRVDLDGVAAYLRSNTDGRNNWEDIIGRGSDNTNTAPEPGADADLEIEISGGNLSLTNTPRRVDLAGFDEGTQPIDHNQAFELEGNLVLALPRHAVTGELNYQGLMQYLRGRGLLGVQDLQLSFSRARDLSGDTDPTDLKASADVIIDLANDQAVVEDMILQFLGLRTEGVIEVTAMSNEPRYKGRLELAEFNPKQLLQDLGKEKLQTTNPDALRRIRADMVFNGSADRMDVTELSIDLDRSKLAGRLGIEAFDPLQLSFDLGIDTLNLDDYSLVQANTPVTTDETQVEGAGLLVGSMLLFQGGGDLNIGHLISGGLMAENVVVTVTSNEEEIRFFPISSRLYGGQQQGDVRVFFSAGQPVLTANQVVTGFDAGGLLRDLSGFDRLHGQADVYLKIRTELGGSRRTMSGDVGLSIVDGAIDEVDIPGAIAKATALLGQEDVSGVARLAADRLQFSELIVTGVINQGVLTSDDLTFDSSLINATGSGTINLVNETVNYTLFPELVNELRAQVPEDFRDVSIPVRVTGNLYSPNIAPDVAAGITANQRARMADKAGEVASALLEGLSSGDKKNREK